MSAYSRILQELVDERDRLNEAITAIEGISGNGSRSVAGTRGRRGRRRMSAAGRARIAAAQRARWAKQRGKQRLRVSSCSLMHRKRTGQTSLPKF
jgi:hypothetical protein